MTHVCQLAGRAVDDVRRAEWNTQSKSRTGHGRWGQGAALVAAQCTRETDRRPARRAARSKHRQQAPLPRVPAQGRTQIGLTCLIARSPKSISNAWLAWASRSKLKPFVKLARTLRARRDGILAAIRLGLSNGRMEGLNSKVRLLSHRSFGFHGPQPLIALSAAAT